MNNRPIIPISVERNRPTIPISARKSPPPQKYISGQDIPEALPGKLWDRRLYHGSNFDFKLGDAILPAQAAKVESVFDEQFLPGLREHAFATTEVYHARRWAKAAADRKGGTPEVYLVSPMNMQRDADGFLVDIDTDPATESAIRSKTGFNIEGRFTQEGLEREETVEAARKLVTNSMNDLRIDEYGQSFFLHSSRNSIEVGGKISTTSTERLGKGMAGDALFGKTYGWDALNESSIQNAYNVHKSGYIYITQASSDIVGPDLNLGDQSRKFMASNSRAIRRGANYPGQNCY